MGAKRSCIFICPLASFVLKQHFFSYLGHVIWQVLNKALTSEQTFLPQNQESCLAEILMLCTFNRIQI
jgi:hypothetical protein